jgi:signal peptidase II
MSAHLRGKWVIFWTITCGGLFFDWATKYMAVKTLVAGHVTPVWGKSFGFYLIYNRGALFGIDPRAYIPGFPVNVFFYVFSAIAAILLIVYYANLRNTPSFMYWGISIIMPGAMGNLWDRIFFPNRGVVDFVKVDLGFSPAHPWPIFNMADMYITIGVMLILLGLWIEEIRKKKYPSA